MTIADFIGWVAGGLVLTTFYLKTMLPLRCVAIASNVAFLSYGLLAAALPITVLHALLLPMNLWRLGQLNLQKSRLRAIAHGEFSICALQPYLTIRREQRGTILFTRNACGNELILVLEGRLRVAESGVLLGPGDIVGAECVYGDDRSCSTTVVCATDVRLGSIAADQAWEAFSANKEFAAHILRLALRHGKRMRGQRSSLASIDAVPAFSVVSRDVSEGERRAVAT